MSSSVYATPLITDLYSDGRKDIIVPAFVNRLEVVEGMGGAKLSEVCVHEKMVVVVVVGGGDGADGWACCV